MTVGYCPHTKTTKRFEIPFDVKSGRDTGFGSVYECQKCGLSFVRPMPDVSDVAAHYELDAYYTQGQSHIPDVARTIVDRLLTHLAWRTDKGRKFDPADVIDVLPDNPRALDIGCGAGNLLGTMKKLGMETVGIDPDPKARAEAERNGHSVYPGTAESIPAELLPQRFDLVTMTHVLEHCLDPLKAMVAARSVLAEQGYFYCEVPNAGALYFDTYAPISEMLDVPRHLHFFQKRNLEEIAAQAGLEIIDWRFHGLTRHFNPDWKHWENKIYDQWEAAGLNPPCGRRSFLGDLKLLGAGLFSSPDRRYDSLGFVARHAKGYAPEQTSR